MGEGWRGSPLVKCGLKGGVDKNAQYITWVVGGSSKTSSEFMFVLNF